MTITEIALTLPFACADGDEIIMIGDVHGCAAQFDALLDHASAMPRAPGRRRKLILGGDIIDRGPASLLAIDLAIGAKERVGADEAIHLIGNHEQMLKIALIDEDDPVSQRAAEIWLRNGGGKVIEELMEANPGKRLDVPAALGPDRMAWLDGLVPYHRSRRILAVHAGLNPTASFPKFLAQPWAINLRHLDEDNHWAWVREPFLRHLPRPDWGHHGHFVLHGHTTPSHDPTSTQEQIERCRLNLDGGSFGTGEVRMVRIVGNDAVLVTKRI
ncbi:MAG: hypothetical protein KME20_26865 [Kaiparowitsia implicata GSE-PSE-MK54-09C]|jgi:serine/threonine protein phosphatase 1|nr:hypothetical protein [Kaiparowitsia implicata GSE-PSE-MK54-09C]